MSILTVTVTDGEGTIRLPQEVLEKHGIEKGQELRVIDVGETAKTITLYAVPPGDPIERALGLFKGRGSMARILEEKCSIALAMQRSNCRWQS